MCGIRIKVAPMGKRLCLIILLFTGGHRQFAFGQDKPAAPAEIAAAQDDLSKQLKINRDTLFKGKDEQLRIGAATVMLYDHDPQARKILIGALNQSENSSARIAVCKALIQARGQQDTI